MDRIAFTGWITRILRINDNARIESFGIKIRGDDLETIMLLQNIRTFIINIAYEIE